MPFISKLYFSPVKSLSFQSISKCEIVKNIGIKHDREIAFTRNADFEFSKLLEKDSYTRNHKDFLSLKNTVALNKYSFYLEGKKLTLFDQESKIIEINLDNQHEHDLLCKKLVEIEETIKEPTYLLQNKEFPFFDTTHSKKTHNTISLININSIKDLSKKLGIEIEFQRFRANIYIDNLTPWKEREWIGKTISIKDIKFKVDMHIPRCSATNLKPKTDINTINLPLEIKKIYTHSDMGIYLKPLENGIIEKNDKIYI